MRSLALVFLFLCPILLLAACGDDDNPAPDGGPTADTGTGDAGPAPIEVRPECENLNPDHCLLPWPSSRFLVDDPSTATGRRVEVSLEAIPHNQFDEPATHLENWNRSDGFSAMTSMMTFFPGRLDTANLPDEDHIADSLSTSSPTIVLDAESGALVAHFSEIDQWGTGDPERRSFYVRPAVRLAEDHRYIVAIRDLSYEDGSPVAPSAYFRALRDGDTTEVPELEARRADFEDIFTKLEAAGVPRTGLLEAWDFWTASGEGTWGEMLAMRDDAYERIGDRGIGCTVGTGPDDVVENPNAEVYRRIRGTFTVPLYMETEYEGTQANRNAAGEIEFNGMVEAPFEVDIPVSLRDRIQAGGSSGRVVMYGHGLLGTEGQVGSGGTRVALARMEAVGVGTRYWGMGEQDEGWFINNVVTDFGNFWQMGERIMQGTINSLVLARSFKGVCSELPELQIDDGSGTMVPAYDTSELYYYGISQGGIFGATVAGLTTDIDRFALQVGAINYPIMINRSVDFDVFETVYGLWYPDKVDRDWFIVASASGWDATDPATYAPHLLADPLAGSATKRLFYHVSHYDAQVSNVASDIAARTMGLGYFASSVYEPWNLETAASPADSAYVIYALDTVEPIPIGARTNEMDNDAHGDLRYQEPLLMMLDAFLRPDGQVEDHCPAGSCLLVNTR